MARITKQSSIHTTGVSFENEPIIKSDGAGEVMQWQPSDGGVDGIFITEDSANDPLRMGIGVAAPAAPLHISGSTTDNNLIIESTDGTNTTAPDLVLYRNSASAADNDFTGVVRFRGTNDAGTPQDVEYGAITSKIIDASDGTEAGDLGFWTMKAGTLTEHLTVGSSGAVSIPSGSVTIGSLDIGHGLGAHATNTQIGTDALDTSGAGAEHNVAVGNSAGTAITSGDNNTYVGSLAGLHRLQRLTTPHLVTAH